jgi:hypothetical protein
MSEASGRDANAAVLGTQTAIQYDQPGTSSATSGFIIKNWSVMIALVAAASDLGHDPAPRLYFRPHQDYGRRIPKEYREQNVGTPSDE